MAIGTPVLGTPTEDSAATTSRNVAWPSPINNGDVALLVGVNGSTSNGAVTTPTGFTSIAQLSGTGNTAAPAVYMARHNCDGTETGNLAVSTPGGSGVQATFAIIIFPGVVNGSGGLDVTAVTNDKTTASSAIAFTSGITTLTDGDTLVYVVAGNSTSITATPMTGFTEAFDRIAAGRRGWEVGYRQGLAAGSYTPSGGTWSGSTKDVGILVALKPVITTVPGAGTAAGISSTSGAAQTQEAGAGTTAAATSSSGAAMAAAVGAGTTGATSNTAGAAQAQTVGAGLAAATSGTNGAGAIGPPGAGTAGAASSTFGAADVLAAAAGHADATTTLNGAAGGIYTAAGQAPAQSNGIGSALASAVAAGFAAAVSTLFGSAAKVLPHVTFNGYHEAPDTAVTFDELDDITYAEHTQTISYQEVSP